MTTTPKRWWLFGNLAHRAVASVLRGALTPHAAARLTPRRVVTLLKQAGRRNDAGLAEKTSTTLRGPALRQPAPVEHALGIAALGLIETPAWESRNDPPPKLWAVCSASGAAASGCWVPRRPR